MLLPVFFGAIGLVLGSFATMLIVRLPEERSIWGRSQCDSCRHTLGILQLVPVLSYLLHRGRCAQCRVAIGAWTLGTELASGALFLLALQYHSQQPAAGLLLALACWVLLVIAIIDARTQMIADALNISLIIIAFLYQWALGPPAYEGAAIGIAWFGGQWLLSRGRWIGTGDILLGIGMGVLLGAWQPMVAALLLAYMLGACVAVPLLLTGKKTRKDTLPFGPFLAAGTIIAALNTERIHVLFNAVW